jgi:hypothetical protein
MGEGEERRKTAGRQLRRKVIENIQGRQQWKAVRKDRDGEPNGEIASGCFWV